MRGSLGLVVIFAASSAAAQSAPSPGFVPGIQGSGNVHVLSHIPTGGELKTGDIEIEQELSRPYVYQSLALRPPNGFDVISLKDPRHATVIWSWRIEHPELHVGLGALRGRYFKTRGRYYYAQCFQFLAGGPDIDLGLVVFDVTGLPDTARIKEIVRVRTPEAPGGFHNVYAYKHSSGQVLLFTSVAGKTYANIFDAEKLVSGGSNFGLIGRVPNPAAEQLTGVSRSIVGGYHDYFVGYDPASHQDRFYGAGARGYYIYDVTDVSQPKLLTSITGVAGVSSGHTFTPTPDGRYAVTEVEAQYAPLRIFDLKPGLDGAVKTISRPIGAWISRWDGLPHNHEVRWPYVFVSAYEDGLQIFNMMDPTNPYTVGFYDTYEGPNLAGCCSSAWATGSSPDPKGRDMGNGAVNGAFGVQVRNSDGLIVISDITTGFWAFKMDGFDGWNGHDWGMPNMSSAQDWENGPDGAPRPTKVS